MLLKFYFATIILVNSFFCSGNIETENEFCDRDKVSCSGYKNNKEDSEFIRAGFNNQIMLKISSSLQNYTQCKFGNCSCYLNVLNQDLLPFSSGISKKMIDSVKAKGVTYIIYDHKLYRDKECLFPARCSGIEYFLKKLASQMNNTELIINTRDWPQINKHFQPFGPVLSFSKTEDYRDIMYPAWSFWEGGPAIKIYPTGLGRWDKHIKSLTQESLKWSWQKKKTKAFFRGSRTSEKRDLLIKLSRKKPELIDAQYTKNQAWKSFEDTLGKEPAEVVPLEDHCQYKYLFNFRGVSASFRFKHLFLCGSLVIHVGSDWLEFFYPALKPWVHFVPVDENASETNIIELLLFLKEHDSLAQEIAERGQKFISNNLRLKDVKCYWKMLLKQYQKLLNYSVKLDKSLIEIN